MKLPSFAKLVDDYKKAVENAIIKCIEINEASFHENKATIAKILVKQEEYSAPKLLITVDTEANPRLYGFQLQCVFNDKDNQLIDVKDTFIDTRGTNGRGISGVKYAEIYLPENLEEIEKIMLSLNDPIYEQEPVKKASK